MPYLFCIHSHTQTSIANIHAMSNWLLLQHTAKKQYGDCLQRHRDIKSTSLSLYSIQYHFYLNCSFLLFQKRDRKFSQIKTCVITIEKKYSPLNHQHIFDEGVFDLLLLYTSKDSSFGFSNFLLNHLVRFPTKI